ncbi:ferrous iron transport protein B [Zhurongbacter thermophilus]
MKTLHRLRVALAGNPNVGKSALFNVLTGIYQHTANWPGKTVERKEGFFDIDDIHVEVVDLPGIYSLTVTSPEEEVTREFLANEDIDVVINVVDASNLFRNLMLTIQLLELFPRVILFVNMLDVAEAKGVKIDLEKLSKKLGIPVVGGVVVTGQGIDELKKVLKDVVRGKVHFHPVYPVYGQEVEILEEYLAKYGCKYPPKFAAVKALEGDEEIIKLLKEKGITIPEPQPQAISQIRAEWLKNLLKDVFIVESYEPKQTITDKIDMIVTHPIWGYVVFMFAMFLMFYITFTFGGYLSGLIEMFFSWLGDTVSTFISSELWKSFIVDAVIGGVGSVLTFTPIIFTFFLMYSILEDSGYIARAAAMMDRLMHLLGLPAKLFFPLILGMGCTVPAVMGTTAMEEEERKLGVYLVGFMPCSARLAVYSAIVSAFFTGYTGALVIVSMYLIGFFAVVVGAKVLKMFGLARDTMPLVIELPSYHIPHVKTVLYATWIRTKEFIYKAGTLIFVATIIIWMLVNMPFGVKPENSYLAILGKAIAPLFYPLGLADWRIVSTLIPSFAAKEAAIATIGVLYGGVQMLKNAVTVPQILVFLVFFTLYTPCMATLGAIYSVTKRWKVVFLSVLFSFSVAYVFAFIARLVIMGV